MSEHGGGERDMLSSSSSQRAASARGQASSLPSAGGAGGERTGVDWLSHDLADTEPPDTPLDAYFPSADELAIPLDQVAPNSAAGQRFYTRRLIQEFLSSVPRSETEVRLTFLRFDGSLRVLTREQLSEIVDNLRPRQRQLVRLAIEERWPRQRVCDYLHISLKTFERAHQEVLDLLAQM